MINLENVNAYEYIKTIKDKSIDLIYTDIPYIYKKGGTGKSELAKNRLVSIKQIKKMSNGIDFSILDEFVRVEKKINIYIWCSKYQILELMEYFVSKYKCNFEILTWWKTNAIPACNHSYMPDLEYCLFFREKNALLKNDDVKRKRKCFVSTTNKDDKLMFKHPTIKPLEYVKNHILNSSNEGDLVFDPFTGSGTTAVACKDLNRNFIGCEIDESIYIKALDRINHITVIDRKKIESGQMTIYDYSN